VSADSWQMTGYSKTEPICRENWMIADMPDAGPKLNDIREYRKPAGRQLWSWMRAAAWGPVSPLFTLPSVLLSCTIQTVAGDSCDGRTERDKSMPKYLIQGRYTPDGVKGLAKDKASGRKAAVQAAMKTLKGKVESFYFALGADDVVVIVDAPDNIAVAALSLSVGSTGLVNISTTPLLTVDEVDQALALPSRYRAPGQEN
jgi:uncharacterized protein with GYD domain